MKWIMYVLAMVVCGRVHAALHYSGDKYTIVIEPIWRTLGADDRDAQKLGGQWILVGNFTFKKRSQETVQLNKLVLQWHGPIINKLVGELYSKRPDRDFLPIEEYFVCDGIWCKSNQELLLEFQYPLTLGPINEFCLVLTLPKELQEILKKGFFDLSLHALPTQFREAFDTTRMSLSLHVPVHHAVPSEYTSNMKS